MAQSLTILSDIHGCWLTLQALLAKCPPENRVIFLGDCIDRGPRSKEVIDYAMDNKIEVCKGNHCALCVDHYTGNRHYEHGVWRAYNGGNKTIKSYHGRVPHKVITWMSQLPLYIIPPEYPNLLLSHTGHGLSSKEDQHENWGALWNREFTFPEDGYFRVFGHTPQKTALVTPTYACIDGGAAYKDRGYGLMFAMLWPSKEIIQQEYID